MSFSNVIEIGDAMFGERGGFFHAYPKPQGIALLVLRHDLHGVIQERSNRLGPLLVMVAVTPALSAHHLKAST